MVDKILDGIRFHAHGGTGYAAERANNLYDNLTFHPAKIVGDNNAMHGVVVGLTTFGISTVINNGLMVMRGVDVKEEARLALKNSSKVGGGALASAVGSGAKFPIHVQILEIWLDYYRHAGSDSD